jgi:hypothetical protein
MSKIKLFIASLFISLACGSNALAQEYGLELLTIGPSTQAFGLNDAVTAQLLGASNLYTNPANLALEDNSSLNADYTLWIGEYQSYACRHKPEKRSTGYRFWIYRFSGR